MNFAKPQASFNGYDSNSVLQLCRAHFFLSWLDFFPGKSFCCLCHLNGFLPLHCIHCISEVSVHVCDLWWSILIMATEMINLYWQIMAVIRVELIWPVFYLIGTRALQQVGGGLGESCAPNLQKGSFSCPCYHFLWWDWCSGCSEKRVSKCGVIDSNFGRHLCGLLFVWQGRIVSGWPCVGTASDGDGWGWKCWRCVGGGSHQPTRHDR